METEFGNLSLGSGTTYVIEPSKEPGAIERFDQELTWLDETIGHLEAKLGPILSQYADADAKVSSPRPEPSSQFRARLEHLEMQRSKLGQIIERIDL